MSRKFDNTIELEDFVILEEPTNSEKQQDVDSEGDSTPYLFGLTKYQSLVLFAAWLGWGFDLFDSLLFTYAAPSCIPCAIGILS